VSTRGVIIIALAEKVSDSLAGALTFPFNSGAAGVVGNEGWVLAQSLRVSVWRSSRSVGNEAEQCVYVSAFDLDRQLSCPRVHDDDRRRRVFLFYYVGKPHRVTDIIKLIAENSVDSNLVRTLNKLRRAQVHRRGSGWRTFELTESALAHKVSIFLYCLLNCSTANLKRRGSKANISFRASHPSRATSQQMPRALRTFRSPELMRRGSHNREDDGRHIDSGWIDSDRANRQSSLSATK